MTPITSSSIAWKSTFVRRTMTSPVSSSILASLLPFLEVMISVTMPMTATGPVSLREPMGDAPASSDRRFKSDDSFLYLSWNRDSKSSMVPEMRRSAFGPLMTEMSFSNLGGGAMVVIPVPKSTTRSTRPEVTKISSPISRMSFCAVLNGSGVAIIWSNAPGSTSLPCRTKQCTTESRI